MRTLEKTDRLYRWAMALAVITIGYNFVEGGVSTYFGLKDETFTLFGFGADSFVETISAIGVAQMVARIQRNPESSRGPFEQRALRITGWSFFILVAILVLSAAYIVWSGHTPQSTTAGMIIGGISIVTMWALIWAKTVTGRKLDSAPVIADARCNLVCLYMSVILLAASILYALFEIPYIDAAGALGLAYFSFTEGREAFEKASGLNSDCC